VRTDNDTWDIKTSVGSTALFVAAARALEAQKSDPAAVDPYAEVFCRAVGGEWAELLDGNAPEHPLNTEFGQHFVNFQGVRTRYFDTYFRATGDDGTFFTLVYNEQHEPAAQWFGHRGWRAAATPLLDCLRSVGRAVPAADSEAGAMTSNISLVSATKR
jgi:O-methyltransferase involved in polyketide biosynthesis